MGLFVMQHFTDEDVVSPPGLRRGLFTVGDTDNIDHNTSSTTTAEYVHGTAISFVSSTYYHGRWAEERHACGFKRSWQNHSSC